MTQQPPTYTTTRGRTFNLSATGLIAIIMNSDERMLMLAHPKRPNKWEPVNGAYEATESLLDGFNREIIEEAGADIQTRPLCAVHAYNFPYDTNLKYMISIVFLFEYLGGKVIPGDDMQGSEVRWMSLDDINAHADHIVVPRAQPWIFTHAVQLYRLLKDQTPFELQPPISKMRFNKYGQPTTSEDSNEAE